MTGTAAPLVAAALHAFGPAITAPLLDRLEARPELAERKVTADIGAGVEWSVINELIERRPTGVAEHQIEIRKPSAPKIGY